MPIKPPPVIVPKAAEAYVPPPPPKTDQALSKEHPSSWVSDLVDDQKDGIRFFSDLFTLATQKGLMDPLLLVTIAAWKDDDDIYHIYPHYWQSLKFVGYNTLFDDVLKAAASATGGSADAIPFEFDVNGVTHVVWVWKGDYVNLGAGAEGAIYIQGIGQHFFTAPELAMPMQLTLTSSDKTIQYFDYYPSDNQWWITGFNPQFQDVYAHEMIMTLTINFSSRPDLFEGFQNRYDNDISPWTFNGETATLVW